MSQTTAQLVSEINGGPLAGMRNRIMNGAMTLSQRGTSFPAAVNGTYTLDRWLWSNNGSMVCTVTQSTDVPNDTFQFSYKVDVTTADTSFAAGEYATILQAIEGYNVRDLIGTTFTLSFWVKSPKTGVHCVSFRNDRTPTADRTYVKEYTVTTANTWEYKTVTVAGGLITAGTWNWANGIGLDVLFTLGVGTTFQATADAWQTGNFIGTANQVNVMDNTANDFFFTGVQLEPGSVATPFERRPFGTELASCQRYYEKIVPTNTIGYVQAANIAYFFASFSEKRSLPSVSFTGTTSNGIVFGSGSSTTFNGTYTVESTRVNNIGFDVTTSTSVLTGGQAVRLQVPPVINIDAEL